MSLFGEFESLFSKGGLARMADIRKGGGREIEGARPRASEEAGGEGSPCFRSDVASDV